ncbi:hypothetical protein [Streptomyces sp. NPDC001530]|uniref:hypothetical protein n=1 Tax=Streptomyces sp. NPDC001530 TaxID=3364582 RepID=UPI0036AB4693
MLRIQGNAIRTTYDAWSPPGLTATDITAALPEDRGATSTTVTLTKAPAYQQKGGLDLNGYCKSIGNTGGVSLDGATSGDWHCVPPNGKHVSMSMDDARTQTYPYVQSAFSRAADINTPGSWACWSS